MSDTSTDTETLPSHEALLAQAAVVPAEVVAEAMAAPAHGDPLAHHVQQLTDRLARAEAALADLAEAFPKLTTLAQHFTGLFR